MKYNLNVLTPGGVLWAGGGPAVLPAGRGGAPAAVGGLRPAGLQQLSSRHGPEAEGGVPEEPGGVHGHRGGAAVRQVTARPRPCPSELWVKSRLEDPEGLRVLASSDF